MHTHTSSEHCIVFDVARVQFGFSLKIAEIKRCGKFFPLFFWCAVVKVKISGEEHFWFLNLQILIFGKFHSRRF